MPLAEDTRNKLNTATYIFFKYKYKFLNCSLVLLSLLHTNNVKILFHLLRQRSKFNKFSVGHIYYYSEIVTAFLQTCDIVVSSSFRESDEEALISIEVIKQTNN